MRPISDGPSAPPLSPDSAVWQTLQRSRNRDLPAPASAPSAGAVARSHPVAQQKIIDREGMALLRVTRRGWENNASPHILAPMQLFEITVILLNPALEVIAISRPLGMPSPCWCSVWRGAPRCHPAVHGTP